MLTTQGTTRPCLVRTIILFGVIACLCFSVGEGLRLTPFPVSALAEDEAPDAQYHTKASHATASNETPLRKYGPLDVPTRVQKRGKRQLADYGNPLSQSSPGLTVRQVLSPETREPVGVVSVLCGSRSTGRAPPFICWST